MPFPMIWTWITDSISYNDNCYALSIAEGWGGAVEKMDGGLISS